MRNILFNSGTKRLVLFTNCFYRSAVRNCSMATNQPAIQEETEGGDSTQAGADVNPGKKRNLSHDPEDWKMKRKKMEDEDGEVMLSRKEQGLPFRKKKVAMLMMYCGKDYHGMQVQREDQTMKYHTIESDLYTALHKSGVITEAHAQEVKTVKFQRAARTDKGVSASGQVCSLMIKNPTEKINAYLPPQIRILGIKRATKGFDCKNACDGRTYSYLLPTFALCPVEEDVLETFRVKEETLKRVNEVLALYKGTHNFHNYTSGKKPSDPSSRRYIMNMQIGSPFVQDGLEFASITVKGQSFMLHQIRKMIGLMIAIVRGLTSVSAIEHSWLPVRRDVPKAPGLGLMLEQVHYATYNKRYAKTHDKIDCDEYKEEIEKFKKEHIYKVMIETEKKEKSMMQWLSTLHMHHFGECETDLPITAETPLGQAARRIIKEQTTKEETRSDVVGDKSESSGVQFNVEENTTKEIDVSHQSTESKAELKHPTDQGSERTVDSIQQNDVSAQISESSASKSSSVEQSETSVPT